MIIRVVDVETLGLTPADGVCEIATVDLVRDGDDARAPWQRGRMWTSLVNPGKLIPPAMSAIHHITDAMVKGAPALDALVPEILAAAEDDKPPGIFAAHNARFDGQFVSPLLGGAGQWICTYKLGVTLWPESPSHSNQCLRYFLGLNLDPAKAMPPHRALPDAYVTAAILRRALRDFVITPEDMVEISAKPVLLPRLHFGQYAGQPIADVPTGYFEWMTKQASMDPDALYTAQCYLHDRRAAARSRGPVSADTVHAQQERADRR